MSSACQSFQLLLSAYADGEVSVQERSQVDVHLSGCADCRARLQDLQSLSQVVAATLIAKAEDADFSRFADQVMARITPDRPGLLERLRIGWQEILTYHRAAVVSSMVTAAVTLAIAVPLVYRYALSQGPGPEVIVQDLQLDDPNVKPVVMKLDNGKTLIMLVRQPDADEEQVPNVTPEPPKGGEL
ncbi:MAG: zf-HC2 domain-containing protein [Deltaproteobacteria bacterium]|nr:zf-HC2 domain-containing protein [Deltaproteobacteria bacterium]